MREPSDLVANRISGAPGSHAGLSRCSAKLWVLLWMCFSTSACAYSGQVNEGDSESSSARLENGRVLFDIPTSALGTDFLLVRNQVGQKLVRWARQGDTLHLIAPPVQTLVGSEAHAATYLRHSLFNEWRPSVLAAFPIRNLENESWHEVDVTSLFIATVDGIPGREGAIDSSRSYVNKVYSYSGLIEVRATHTYFSASLWENEHYPDEPLTVSAFWSLVRLPSVPMRPRRYDSRMGFHNDAYVSYRPTFPAGIMRWRLEKKRPLEPVSEPQKPIVFHLTADTPDWMRPWLKAGIESWLPAFEAAGFQSAIVVRDAPQGGEEFDDRSMRFSVVRLYDKQHLRRYTDPKGVPSGGGTVDPVWDPRTGELLKADILIQLPNDQSRADYFAFCGALDSRAHRVPFPRSLEGELLKDLAAHEAGHAFGIKDGNFGSFVYPTENLRNPQWLEEMGYTPSVMNYSRCNYVAQPEDNLPPKYILLRRVGPADIHQIRWGYTQFAQDSSWANERSQLEAIVGERTEKPWYTFIEGVRGVSPQLFLEAVDTDDPVAATELGLKNLKRSIELLPQATLHKDGGNLLLEEMYFQTISRWVTLMQHVASMIGGYTVDPKSATEKGELYVPVPAERQREAMKYLGVAAFDTPLYLMNTAITRRFESKGTSDNIVGLQIRVLNDLIKLDRLQNIAENELTIESGAAVYGLREFLGDIRDSIWSELRDTSPEITVYRQKLQWAYLDRMKNVLEYVPDVDIRSELRNQLVFLCGDVEERLQRLHDSATESYLEMALTYLESILATNRCSAR